MVKNLSNPLNSRKIAKIITEDAEKKGISVNETSIRLYLSDNQVKDLFKALDELKVQKVISDEYTMSDDCISKLKANDFLDKDISTDIVEEVKDVKYKRTRDHDMKSQLENLQSKIFKLKSVDIQEFDRYLQRFDINFGKPMARFIEDMQRQKLDISDVQAFSVVFSADHLSLRETAKDVVYYNTFGRFDEIKNYLNSLDIRYTWPIISGTAYIDKGKKYSTSNEIIELAHVLRTASGIDTYSDEIIQEFFTDLLDGSLTDVMVKTKNIWKWNAGDQYENPFDYIIPQLEFDTPSDKREMLIQTSITYLLLCTLEKSKVYFKTIIDDVVEMSRGERIKFLATKLEHSLTKKSIELQFATMVTFHFENLKSDPSKSKVFIDACIRYLNKFESIVPMKGLLNHSIKAGLRNSFGGIRKYLKLLTDDEFDEHISNVIIMAYTDAFNEILTPDGGLSNLCSGVDNIENKIDLVFNDHIQEDNNSLSMEFFTKFMGFLFSNVSEFVKNLEPESKVETDGKGGLKERTENFFSSIKHHASNNSMVKDILTYDMDEYTNKYFASEFELLVQTASYATYQIASKEGAKGETMFRSLVSYFKRKYMELSKLKINDTQSFAEFNTDILRRYFILELTQATVLISLSSKTKTEAYNTWTHIKSIPGKNAMYMNEILINNVLFWHRLPRDMIQELRESGITKNYIREVISKTNRRNLLEAYSLITMGILPDINDFEAAVTYIKHIFKTDDIEVFQIKPKTGEAELINELIHLWTNLIEKSFEKQVILNKYAFPPIELAINLTKGFIHEYKGRNWFDQIYFGKLAMSADESGLKPILYKFTLNYLKKYDSPLPENILMTFYYPVIKRITNLAGLVIIGGTPDIYNSYRATKLITPYLESLQIEKYPIDTKPHAMIIEETLNTVSTPVNVKSALEIMEQTVRKKGDNLATFYPIIKQEEMDVLSLPNDFRVDAVFVIGIVETFFSTENIGDGIKNLSLYLKKTDKQIHDRITGNFVYPLIFKWQPIYNDILNNLKKEENRILPDEFEGHLKPDVIVFEQVHHSYHTVLITNSTEINGKLFYNVAMARSGYGDEGQPISHLQSGLSREKFGSKSWKKSIQEYNLMISQGKEVINGTDKISSNLVEEIQELSLLTSDDLFDLGLVMSLRG